MKKGSKHIIVANDSMHCFEIGQVVTYQGSEPGCYEMFSNKDNTVRAAVLPTDRTPGINEQELHHILFAEWVAQEHYRLVNIVGSICLWEDSEGDVKNTEELWLKYVKEQTI